MSGWDFMDKQLGCSGVNSEVLTHHLENMMRHKGACELPQPATCPKKGETGKEHAGCANLVTYQLFLLFGL